MKTKNIILIIIILVILALFLLVGIIAPYYFGFAKKIRWDPALPRMAPIESAIDVYKLNTGQIPDSLKDLITCPDGFEDLWKGPYLKEKQLYDPWYRSYVYQINPNDPNRYMLISYGQDGKPGGEGFDSDIYND